MSQIKHYPESPHRFFRPLRPVAAPNYIRLTDSNCENRFKVIDFLKDNNIEFEEYIGSITMGNVIDAEEHLIQYYCSEKKYSYEEAEKLAKKDAYSLGIEFTDTCEYNNQWDKKEEITKEFLRRKYGKV